VASTIAPPDGPTGTAEHDWSAFYRATVREPPRATLVHALGRFDAEPSVARRSAVARLPAVARPSAVPRPSAAARPSAVPRRSAVDLGCGVGQDTVELLRRGWHVIAVDAQPAALRCLLGRPDLPRTPRLVLQLTSFEAARWPRVELVNASYALPFCPPRAFPGVWARVVASLRPGGRFAGQFFGEQDDWAALSRGTHHTRAAVQDLLRAFEVELFREVQYDGRTATGVPKHWHIFDVVARKLAPHEPRSR